MKHVYIASGWFNNAQREDLETIEYLLLAYQIPHYSPRKHAICKPLADGSTRKVIFDSNVAAIDSASYVIVNTRDKDMGTIFEAGYAYAKGIPIVYVAFGLSGAFNLMLAESGLRVATTLSDLRDIIHELANNGTLLSSNNSYTGAIE